MCSTSVLRLGLILALGCSVAGCTSDSTPVVYVDLAYQVRCLDCDPRGPDEPVREIKAVNGEDGYVLDCDVRKVDGVRRVTFSSSYIDPKASSSNHVFRIELANIDADESVSSCKVRVVEGVTTYQGACGSDEPDPDNGGPCQTQLRVEKGVIKGGVLCDDIPVEDVPDQLRYVVAPGKRTDPAQIQIYGCHGL